MSVTRDAATRVRAYLEGHNVLFSGSDEVCAIGTRDGLIVLSAKDLAALVEFADTMTSRTAADTHPDQAAIEEVHYALRNGGTGCGKFRDRLISAADPEMVTCPDCLAGLGKD